MVKVLSNGTLGNGIHLNIGCFCDLMIQYGGTSNIYTETNQYLKRMMVKVKTDLYFLTSVRLLSFFGGGGGGDSVSLIIYHDDTSNMR